MSPGGGTESPLRRLQRVAFWVAATSALIGLATASGCAPGLGLGAGWLRVLHPVLFLVGGAAGWAAGLRMREIDRERWSIVEDPLLTSGERQHAHREAERRRRGAGTSLLGAPLLLGYWLSHQFANAGELLAAQLMAVTALLGGIVGLAVERWRRERGE